MVHIRYTIPSKEGVNAHHTAMVAGDDIVNAISKTKSEYPKAEIFFASVLDANFIA